MTSFIDRSLEWIPCGPRLREQVVSEIAASCAGFVDRGDHLWGVIIGSQGPQLFCFGIQFVATNRQEFNDQWFVKRIPEAVAPDVYDCPTELLDMARITNQAWRLEVERRRLEAAAKEKE